MFNVIAKINEKRMSRLATKIVKLKETFDNMEIKITSEINEIEVKSNETLEYIDNSIARLQSKKAKLLDEKDKVINDLSINRNKIIKVRENMFKEVDAGV